MRMRVLAAVAVAFVLVGCSTGRPGAAIVVDGDVVSMSDVDEASQIICELSLAQQPGGSFPGGQVRGQAAAELALALVADDVAEDSGISIPTNEYELTQEERRSFAESAPDLETDFETVVAFLEQSTRVAKIAQELGAAESGEQVTPQNAQELGSVGRAQLVEALSERDVDVSPRLEIGDLGKAASRTGLAVPATTDEEGEATPASAPQTCA